MNTVANILDSIQNKFNKEAAAGLNIVFQFIIDDSEKFYLNISNQECELVQGQHDNPSVSLIMTSETLSSVASGEIGGMQAFMSGKLTTEGNMMLATKLSDLFDL